MDFSGTTSLGVAVNLFDAGAQVVNARLSINLSGPNRIENVVGTPLDDVFRGNQLDNEFTGGFGNDTYFFDADGNLGSDTIYEAADGIGGVDTISFIETTGVGVTLDLGSGSPQLVAPDFGLTLSNGTAIEKAIGGAANDVFSVKPSTLFSYSLNGGAGLGDVLNYDSLTLATAQTADTLTTVGFLPVSYLGFETIHILNPAPVFLMASLSDETHFLSSFATIFLNQREMVDWNPWSGAQPRKKLMPAIARSAELEQLT